MTMRARLARKWIPQIVVVCGLMPLAVGFILQAAPDDSGRPTWIPAEPPTTYSGWPIGHFACGPDESREYGYHEANGVGGLIVAKSPPAETGKKYCFQVGHCGLESVVDFDGSFWEVTGWDTAERPQSLVSAEFGSIELVGPDEVEFTAWRPEDFTTIAVTGHFDHGDQWAERVTLRRIPGPIVLEACF
jgi:hypothetical protein